MNNLCPTRLKIWINKKPVIQGKFYFRDGKPTFLFNVDKNKWMRNYSGYGIAEQIIEAFQKAKLSVYIIAKNTDTHINYVTNRSMIFKKGVKAKFGGHTQWFLPLVNWEVFTEPLEEPYGLSAKTCDEWLNPPVNNYQVDASKAEYLAVMSKLGEVFRQKYTNLDV